MSRSIDAIWRSKAQVADRELERVVGELATLCDRLESTAGRSNWQQHYDAALEACRLSRTARFRFNEPDRFSREAKSELVEVLTRVLSVVRSDKHTHGISYRVKNLDAIRKNIEYRLDRIMDESDAPVFSVD